jgi:predicted RNA-binding protein with PUA-like domain
MTTRLQTCPWPEVSQCDPMEHRYWLVKQEPEAYSWQTFLKEGKTSWTGVRNYQARNHLRSMQEGDRVLYYHSVTGKEIVGWARVIRSFYPDPTADGGDWSCVDLEPGRSFVQPVTLDQLKADPVTRDMPLIRQSRLSVMPLTTEQFRHIMTLGGIPDACP